MLKAYRKGAVGALMDEYERASIDFKEIINELPQSEYIKILDPLTKDDDCRSVQTIINHVIRSGYEYADSIRRAIDKPVVNHDYRVNTPGEALADFEKMLKYTEETLEGKWEMSYDELVFTEVIGRNGFKSTIEARLEHAIVHILRHRRQLEKLLQ